MSASQAAPHDSTSPESFRTAVDNSTAFPPLILTEEDLTAFDPLTRLAAKMMIANGKAILKREV